MVVSFVGSGSGSGCERGRSPGGASAPLLGLPLDRAPLDCVIGDGRAASVAVGEETRK